MYKGKHLKSKKYRLTPWAIFALVVMLIFSVGSTVAYLFTSTDPVTNTFTPAPVVCQIEEGEFKQSESVLKTGVFVKNTGEADAHIRATIVITWQDEAGNVYGSVPELGTDYTLSVNDQNDTDNEAGWTKVGDYWYCTQAGNPNTQTSVLINFCEALKSLDGYTLNVEILAQAVQAEPDSAVEEAWGSNLPNLAVIYAGGV
ncbi:MAG: hypothetical protein J6D61_04145 [Clostridia bacterium]|nr:hypothetical protein [Clostridia bacterium]